MVQHSEVARTESSRRVTMLAVLVMFTVSVFAAAIGIPADAAVHTTPLVSGVAYGPLPEQRLDVHLLADGTGPFPVSSTSTPGAGSQATAPSSPTSSPPRSNAASPSCPSTTASSPPLPTGPSATAS